MKRIVLCCMLFALLACALSGCITYQIDSLNPIGRNVVEAGGVKDERGYEVDAFDSIRLEGPMTNLHVYLSTGPNSLSVKCDESYFGALDIETRGDKLIISTDRTLLERIDVYVSAPAYTSIDCRGAAELIGVDQLTGDSLKISIAGAADGELDLDYDELEVDIAGAGSLKLKGTADSAYLTCAGACDISARNLTTQTCRIDLAGAGTIEIRCEEELETAIGGIGTVNYWGNPSIRRSGAGFGSITGRGD